MGVELSGGAFMVRAMKTFECISQELEQAIAAQAAVLRSLETAHLDNKSAVAILDGVAHLQRLVEMSAVVAAGALDPLEGRVARGQLAHQLRISRKQLGGTVRLSAELLDEPAGLGCPEGRPARMPHVAEGMRNGQFGAESALIISRVLDQVPEDTPLETVEYVERILAEIAAKLGPDDLKVAGQKILQGLNAESAPKDEDRQRRRSVKLSPQGEDLMATLTGSITPELHALLSRLFADYAGPGDLLPEEEKARDSRTTGQRCHDALTAALKTAMGEGGGMRPTRGCATVVATMTLEQLQVAAGVVPTDVGTHLPIPDLIRLGAERNAFLSILDKDTGNYVELGKTKRCGDVFAYLAAVAAQGGDMTPGSDIPAAWCQMHHVLAWRKGGLTTGSNQMLTNPKTHANIDDDQQDPDKYWTYCTKTGHMLWRPPRSVDPERRPRANFNPARWFNPGQMLKFGLFTPDKVPPFQYPESADPDEKPG